MPNRADPIVAVATAPGRGAVGIVRVSGRGLGALAAAICPKPLPPRVAVHTPFIDADGQPIDHGLALYFPAPHSYTGEDVLELQAHGGPVVLALLVQRCLQAAAEPGPDGGLARLPRLRAAEPGEFSQRAFLNGKLDLAQAEAVADLIDASTQAAARSAARALDGALSRPVRELSQQLIDLRLLIEATLDFPEEEIDVLRSQDVHGKLQNIEQTLAHLRTQARQGALLREGLHVVIAGQPNAGKSSLLNALAGAELAIVTPIPGTTRDKVQQTIQIEGVPLHIVDTAGLRASDDAVERIGIERAWGAIEQADAVLFLHDLTRCNATEYRAADADIASALAQKLPPSVPVIDVWNKADCVPPAPGAADADAGLRLSAHTGAGLDTLRARLLELAGWQNATEGVFMARARHVQALAQVQTHVQAAIGHLAPPMLDLLAEELRLAHQALGVITGEFTPDDLLGAIFSRFCIGK